MNAVNSGHLTVNASGAEVVILLLAAGMATRMGVGAPHKLLAEFNGVPLVRRAALIACASIGSSVVAVTGHRHEEIQSALVGLNLKTTYNADYQSGIASSLVAALNVPVAREADGVLVLLADMPALTVNDLDRLVVAFQMCRGVSIVRAVSCGKPGNPIILPRSLLNDVLKLTGDMGARYLIETSGLPFVYVEIGAGALLDVDIPDAVRAAGEYC